MPALGMTLSLVFLIPFLYLSFRVLRLWSYCRRRHATRETSLPIHEGEAPELFELIERTRKRAGLRKPVEVRTAMLPFVGEIFPRSIRGSGRGSYPIVVGLPLMAALTPQQLEAMLLYEMTLNLWPGIVAQLALMKHIASGFVARAERNTYSLGEQINYFTPFLRCCDAALRARNRCARAAAETQAGQFDRIFELYREVIREFFMFWKGPVKMLQETGHSAPLLEGFERFWRTHVPDPFRSECAQGQEQSALSLLRSPAAIEARFTSAFRRGSPDIEPVSWGQTGTVLPSSWGAKIAPFAPALSRLRAVQIGEIVHNHAVPFGRRLFQRPGRLYDPGQLRSWTASLLAMALSVALSRAGWEIFVAGQNSPVAFTKDGNSIEPFQLMDELLSGRMNCDAWSATCLAMGIAELPLS